MADFDLSTEGDADVVKELRRFPAGPVRTGCAVDLMRLGVLATRMANGRVDARVIEDAGRDVVRQLDEVLATRSGEMVRTVAGTLERYFDSSAGLVPQRIEALIRRDGELERILEAHLGAEDSLLARTLGASLGSTSPVLRMLSSTDRDGIQARLTEILNAALADQRKQLLREFSLDNRESALSRLVAEIGVTQNELQTDLKGRVEMVVREFSLDQPNSALSRLVGRVEATQKSIAEQFSLDSDMSALSRLSRMLSATTEEITKNLTLDSESSALSRLNRSLVQAIDGMRKGNQEFQDEVRLVLATFQARREEAARTTTHGATFELQVGEVLQIEAQRAGDVYEATGNTVGIIKNCKVGDHLITVGPDGQAPGARIVWESKEQKSCDLKGALKEIEQGRKNRQAQIGVFVFSKRTVPAGLQPFARYGSDLVVVWDSEDVATDLYLRVAVSVGRALAARVKQDADDSSEGRQEIEAAVRAIEKQLTYLEEIRKWAETIQANGGKIADRAFRIRTEIEKQVASLDEQLASLDERSEA